MSRRLGNGTFGRNQKALDTFGRAGGDISDAYLVYVLTEDDGFSYEDL